MEHWELTAVQTKACFPLIVMLSVTVSGYSYAQPKHHEILMHQACTATYDWIARLLCRSSQYVSRNLCSSIKQKSYFRWIDKSAVNLKSHCFIISASPHHTQLPSGSLCLGTPWVSITAHLTSLYTPTSISLSSLTHHFTSLPSSNLLSRCT